MRAFRIAYDGRPFYGFQRQPDVPTVSDAILDAVADLDIAGADHVPSGYAAAGRTDRGVSAIAQTVAFEAPEWCSAAALDGRLPETVHAWAHSDAPEAFHATHDATERTYRYYLYAPDRDLDRAQRAADWCSGEHDFHNLTPDDRGTVRDLSIGVEREDDFLVVTVASDGFPRSLVRRLVTLLDSVAAGTADRDRVMRVLGPAPIDGPEGVPPAPPEGLVLAEVCYPGLDFRIREDLGAVRDAIAERHRDHRTIARVQQSIGEAIYR
ncbi:tRNA pseudouridine(38-40) synthase TruA [Halococcoides cellulosivorans]|uniref:tRNA pseudouridine synthase A n=1 Tax=Halococcoides cellulosivorans TaxID=1679096 RepID=A0A2R4X1P7_9EURY|nr:tRNA pseudouridine(38-40) synthase TruA [Halococcoides cellulosivorans]AWB27724.1 tRNA pseudouridine(38-40) synthase TruA [Halococcoides cellulosivorans]